MSVYHGWLRKKPRISYFEPDEPNSDEYIYCEKCADFVFAYCSIHGPLLVIPDDKIYNGNARAHAISAADEDNSNWMRYVNCSRHYGEQNIVAFQFRGEIYYRTIKVIQKFTELLVFYGSEFAAALQIDLRKYNDKKYYRDATSVVTGPKQAITKIKENAKNTTTVEIAADIYKPDVKNHAMEDEFVYMDEDTFGTDDYKVETNINSDEVMDYTEMTYNDNYKNEFGESNYQRIEITDIDKKMHEEDRKFDIHVDFQEVNNVKAEKKGDIEKYYTCDICNKIIVKRNKHRHDKRVHNVENKLNCPECSFVCFSRILFDKHRSTHIGKFSCQFCLYRSDFKTSLHNHLRGVHKYSFVIKCEFCTFTTAFQSHMDHHLEMHASANSKKCNFCDYLTYNSYRMKRHVKKHFNSEMDIGEVVSPRKP